MTSISHRNDAVLASTFREFFPPESPPAISPAMPRGAALSGGGAHGNAAARDLVIIVVATIAFAFVSIRLDLAELVLSVLQPNEHYEIDELPGVLVFVALAIALFAWRRMAEVRTELAGRREAERELTAALDANRRLARANVRIQEDERRSLARELHDEFGQYLNAIKVDAVTIRDAGGDAQAARDGAASIIGIADHVQSVMRETIARLRPAGLDELGLTAALEHCIDGWRKRLPAVRFDFTPADGGAQWDETVNITLYRVVQEALTNVAKHADATRVEIHLEAPPAGVATGNIKLVVRNDGGGRGAASAGSGLGIVGMRERIESLGGRLDAAMEPEGGFRLCAFLPAHSGDGPKP
jgi:signal transduction histidine kinase